MNKDEINRIIYDNGLFHGTMALGVVMDADHLERFANLVAAAEREWQGLTENEIKHLWYEACQTNLELTSQLIVHLARNIEAKLKERNT